MSQSREMLPNCQQTQHISKKMLEERVYARCPQHMSTTTNEAQPQRVGALLPIPSCLGIGGHPSGSRQGHPRYNGEAVGAHTNAQRAKNRLNDACTGQSKTQVVRQTWWRSRLPRRTGWLRYRRRRTPTRSRRRPTFHWQERQGDSTGANVGTTPQE